MSKRSKSRIIGVLILTAYLMLTSEFTNSKAIVLVTDIISGLSVICIALLIFPFVKSTNRLVSIGYVFFKLLEGTLMILGALFFLNDSLAYIRGQIYEGVHLYTFIISGFLFYWVLYKSQVVPKFISLWGMVAILVLLVTTILKISGLHYTFLDMFLILIITNEAFLAIWLIVKGLSQDSPKI